MRDLAVVMEKRNALVKELENLKEIKEKLFPLFVWGEYKNLAQSQRDRYNYIMSARNKMQEQVAVLNFILNEDTEWKDATVCETFDFTLEDLKREANSCKCECNCNECALIKALRNIL